ncbi:MAG TPA: hypothetical protein VHC22_19940 [Pirellulales bacterium]|nr:hypothetical protein [Pirellulales bacterium]
MPFQFYCPQGHLLEGHESQMGQQSQCPMCGSVFMMPAPPGMQAPPGAGMPPGAMPGMASPGAWPGYGQPAAPGYGQQPPPGYGQPGAPMYGQPAAPGYGQQPGYAPGYPPGQFAPGQFPGYPTGYSVPGAFAPPGYGASEQSFVSSPSFLGAVPQPDAASIPTHTAPTFAAPGADQPAEEAAQGFPGIRTEPESAAAPGSAATSGPEQSPIQNTPAEKAEPRIVRIPCPQGHELQTPMDMVNQEVLCPICSTQFYLRYEDSLEYKQEQADLRRRKSEQLNQAALKWAIIAAVVVVVAILGMILFVVLRAPGEKDYRPPEQPTESSTKEPADRTTKDEAGPAATSESAEPDESMDSSAP